MRPGNKYERRQLERQKLESLHGRLRLRPYMAKVKYIVRGENGKRRFRWERPEGEEYAVVRWNHANRAGNRSFVKSAKRRSRRKVRHTRGKFCHGAYRKVYDLRSALN